MMPPVALYAQAPSSAAAEAAAHLAKGTRLMQEELLREAITEFEAALAADPKLSMARFNLGVCLLAEGRNEEARAAFERVQADAGASPHITYYLGRLDLAANDHASAVKRLSSVADRPPYPDTAFHLGVAYAGAGDTASAVKWLEAAVKAEPKNWRARYRLGRAYAAAGREADSARELELYTKLRDERRATETWARGCAEELRTRSASGACAELAASADFEKLLLAGQLLGAAGEFRRALEPLEKAARIEPESFEVWHNLGVTHFRMERLPEARQALARAVALRPDYAESVLLLGGVLYMQGDDAAALPVLERLVKLRPGDAGIAGALREVRARLASGARRR